MMPITQTHAHTHRYVAEAARNSCVQNTLSQCPPDMSHFCNPPEALKGNAYEMDWRFELRWQAQNFNNNTLERLCRGARGTLFHLAVISRLSLTPTDLRSGRPSPGERHCLLRAQEENMRGQSEGLDAVGDSAEAAERQTQCFPTPAPPPLPPTRQLSP